MQRGRHTEAHDLDRLHYDVADKKIAGHSQRCYPQTLVSLSSERKGTLRRSGRRGHQSFPGATRLSFGGQKLLTHSCAYYSTALGTQQFGKNTYACRGKYGYGLG